ncbi:hypothetical protein ACFLTW_01625 [Chloroflexota bacterium]
MKQTKQNFLKDLKQAINNDEGILIGRTGGLSYFRFTKSLQPRKTETFELIDGVLMKIGKFYIIREDAVQTNIHPLTKQDIQDMLG